jgi:hypothetical protein
MSVPPKGWRKHILPGDIPEDAFFTNDGVRYANIVQVLRGSKVVECQLPPEWASLEIFDVAPNHPAYPGRGVRTTEEIPDDTVVAFYAGALRLGSWAPDNPFVFGVEPVEKDFVIDGSRIGNVTRFINDPMGTGCEANLAAEDTSISVKGLSIYCVQFRTMRKIAAGEELFFSYEAGHEGYWKAPDAEIIDLTKEEMVGVKRERSTSSISTEASSSSSSLSQDVSFPEDWGMKVCSGPCRRLLPLNEQNFFRDKNRKCGFRARCKQCRSGKKKSKV